MKKFILQFHSPIGSFVDPETHRRHDKWVDRAQGSWDECQAILNKCNVYSFANKNVRIVPA